MDAPDRAVAALLQTAIGHISAGHPELARRLCEQFLAGEPGRAEHPAVHQMLAVLCMRAGDAAGAKRHIQTSLAQRPDHLPTLKVAGDAARAAGDWAEARALYERSLALDPRQADVAWALSQALLACHDAGACERVLTRLVALEPAQLDAWFQLALVRQDLRDYEGAIEALRQLLARSPDHAAAQVNLGIVLQEVGQIDAAMQAYGRAYRLREDTFGRIAHALSTPPVGRLWLSLDALRAALRAAGR